MKLEQLKVLDVQRIGDTEEGIQAGIDEASLPFVFELVSKQLYSNPIGSIVREITSNCFDSHIEAGVNEPVIISKTHDQEEGFSIEFKDVGVGISPDRVKTIFMNYFSSTKRGNNNEIGGFGIGSKTPLAYADLFYITTIYDGIEYQYLLHKGENKPTLESLLGYDEIEEEYEVNIASVEEEPNWVKRTRINRIPIGAPTEAHNGTVIKINIADTRKVYDGSYQSDIEKFKSELRFQLAYFDNVYFKNWEISNDYDIYEGKHFRFRSDIDQRNTHIHLCIGKVRYPIDFEKIKIAKAFMEVPVAVKFDIGELQITPSRESLRYTPEGIKLIEERITLAVNEIMAIFEKQNPIIDDLAEYERLRVSAPKITFDKDKGHVLNMWAANGLSKNFVFKPLMGLNIKKIPKNIFFMWKTVGYIHPNGTIVYITPEVDTDFVLKRDYVILGRDERMSSYTNIYINRLDGGNRKYLIKKMKIGEDLDYDGIAIRLGIKETKTVGKAKTIMEYMKVADGLVKQHGEFYSDLRPSDEWINDYKRSIIESTAAHIRKKNQKVFVRDMGLSGKGIDMKVTELQNRTGILVYGFKEDKNILQKIHSLVINNKASVKKAYGKSFTRGQKAFMVLQVARNVAKDVVGAKKTVHWEDFFNTKFFKKILTSQKIHNTLEDLAFPNIHLRKTLIRGFNEAYIRAKNSIVDYKSSFYVPEEYTSEDKIIKSKLKEVEYLKEKYSFEIPLIRILGNYPNPEELREIANYLKYKGFKLENKFYLKDQMQLEYEAGLKVISNLFKGIQTNLLTYKQPDNDSEINGEEFPNPF